MVKLWNSMIVQKSNLDSFIVDSCFTSGIIMLWVLSFASSVCNASH